MRVFGDPAQWPDQDLVALTDTTDPHLILLAYREGLFPMPFADQIGWFSPMDRAVFPIDGLRVSRSLRRSVRRYHCTTDRDFVAVMRACGDPRRPHGWITDAFVDWYRTLHRAGFVHSIEVWDDDERLVGGLYGVRVGRLFCGESMFHDPEHGRDASKVALVELTRRLSLLGDLVLDTQWLTPHLASLGAVEIPRREYLHRIREAIRPGRDWESV